VETVHAVFLLPIFPSGSWLLWFLFASCRSEETSGDWWLCGTVLNTIIIIIIIINHIRFFAGVCCSNCQGMIATLNISTLHSRRKQLGAVFLIYMFKNKISFSTIVYAVSLRIPTKIIRDFSTIVFNDNFKGQSVSQVYLCC
jgi:hypothetical protein